MYISNGLTAAAALAARGLPEGHPFVPAGDGDLRSPCPGLNSMANHGYINHNGSDIQPQDLIGALGTVFHLNTTFATSLTEGAIGCCSKSNTSISSLSDLALHGGIEHDASLVHDDANPGEAYAPTTVNQTLLAELVDGKDGLNKNDFAAARKRREDTLATPLDATHHSLALGESALTLLTLQDENGVVSSDVLRLFYGNETLPSNLPPTNEVTSDGVNSLSAEIGQIEDSLD